MGCYLEDYRARVGVWSARTARRAAVGKVGKGERKIPMTPMILSAAVIATLLIIGGVELNSGPEEDSVQVLCNGCDRNLKSGTECVSCGRWYHNSYSNVKIQVVESGKWNCDRRRSERLMVLEENLREAQIQIEELIRRNKDLEERILRADSDGNVGLRSTGPVKSMGDGCLVLGNSTVRNVGDAKPNMRVECFPAIRADQLRRVMENRDLGSADTVIIHVGTNDVRRYRNPDYMLGDTYDIVTTAKEKFQSSRLVLSGVLRSERMKWQRVGAANDRLEWVASRVGATFADPNSWIRDADFGRDGLHLNRNGTRQLGDLYSRICGLDSHSQTATHN